MDNTPPPPLEDSKNPNFPVFVLSGGTGMAGEQVSRTVLAQFLGENVSVRVFPKILHKNQVKAILARAASEGAVIAHTFVDPKLRKTTTKTSEKLGVVAIDLVGPLMQNLSEKLGQEPLGTPGRYHQLHQTYFDRIKAINYTLAHDDGKNPQGWKDAEIILVGASRVGKTPLSLYLSMMGWNVANIPLIPGIPLKKELLEVDHRRVVGLTISPADLLEHRKNRQHLLGLGNAVPYLDPIKIFEEIDAIEKLMKRHKFKIIDTTGKPIETSADDIKRILKRQLNIQKE